MSLANKYRPQNFDSMIGQGHITDILKAQMKSDQKIHHNFLLFGPRGTGKTTAARILAKALNCNNLQDGDPCNECDNCKTINKSTTLDYIEIDAASHTGVDNIREEILDKVPYPPTQLKKKIYVIDEVHMLSKGAFNALLKTIEEPRDYVCFVLATTEMHKVPETIISRCQVFNFKKVLDNEMISHLERICKEEKLKYDEEALSIISKISEGCVRDAVKYVDQISILGDITQEHVTKFLGVASEQTIKNFLDLVKKGDRNEVFSQVNKIYQNGIDLHQFAKQALVYIDRNLEDDMDFLLDVSEGFSEIISTIKYYPYPVIVYKIVFNKYLGGKDQHGLKSINIDKSGNKEIPAPKLNPRSSTGQATGMTSEKDIEEGNKGVVNESLTVEVIKVQTPKPAGSADKSIKSDLKTGGLDKPSTNKNDRDEIRNNVLSKINKLSLQQNLRGNFIIENIEDNVVNAIMINKMTKILLANDENKRILETAFANVMGNKIRIEINFENKEDYFARKMGF